MPSKKCEAEGCGKWASFNHPGLKRPQYCRPHSVPGMVNVVSRQRCTYAGCLKQANFNHPGETRGLYCKAHIQEGMVDVRHKHCGHPGCPKQATCNHPGQPTGAFCGQHKLDGMVNVVLKRCQHEGCETFPSFGHPGQAGVQFCRTHKLPGMIRRTSAAGPVPGSRQEADQMAMDPGRCAHPGCGDCRPIYCFNHFQEHQHDPMNPQLEDPHMHAGSHIQSYADLHHLQQIQSQQEVHGNEHLQAEGAPQHGHVIGHQVPIDSQHHIHVGITETGIPATYPEYAAWQQQTLAAQQGIPHEHEVSNGHHTYDHRVQQSHHTVPRSQENHHTYDDRIQQSEPRHAQSSKGAYYQGRHDPENNEAEARHTTNYGPSQSEHVAHSHGYAEDSTTQDPNGNKAHEGNSHHGHPQKNTQ